MIEVEAKFDEFMEEELWDNDAKDERRRAHEALNNKWAMFHMDIFKILDDTSSLKHNKFLRLIFKFDWALFLLFHIRFNLYI